MTLISDSEMAALRGVAESGMTTPAYIQKKVTSQTANGQKVEWVEQGAPVMGWLYEFTPGGATIGVISGAMGLSEEVWFRSPVGTDLLSGDKLRVGSSVFTVQHDNSESTYRAWHVCALRIVV